MKLGISNNEGIIHQAHSRHLRIYVKLGYSERVVSGERLYQTTVIGTVTISENEVFLSP